MHQKGFTFLEVIVASFVVTVAVGGAFTLIQRNFLSQRYIENREIALGLAQEGVEAVYAIRNSNFIASYSGMENPPGIPVIFTSNGLSQATCGNGCRLKCVNTSSYFPECSVDNSFVEFELAPATDACFNDSPRTSSFLKTTASIDEIVRYIEGKAGSPFAPDSIFQRRIFITQPSADELDVRVEVTWQDRGTPQKVEAHAKLYNWLP